jgi:hypothetical protein
MEGVSFPARTLDVIHSRTGSERETQMEGKLSKFEGQCWMESSNGEMVPDGLSKKGNCWKWKEEMREDGSSLYSGSGRVQEELLLVHCFPGCKSGALRA